MGDLKDDIERYCKGELSPAEMHALERKALTDPFIADALEGAGSVTSDEFEADISTLQKELEQRRRPTVVLWVWAGRIAAGLAVVALITFTLLYQPSVQVAEGDTQASDSEHLAKADSGAASENLAFAEEKPVSDARRKRALPGPSPVEVPREAEITIPENLFNESDFLLPEVEKKAIPPAKIIQGFVVDAEDGRALPGVNVTIKGSTVGTITDEEGNYQIAMDSLSEGLVFSYIGFESREVIPGSKNEVSVALEPDISELSEVVVVGYGTREPAGAEPTIVEMAEPAGGKKAFKQYLEQNLRYPEQALNNKVEGKVTVQFTIQSSGAVSDFRVVKGLGYGCDEEVIRLIQEGPKWQPTKRNHQPVTDKVKVRLKFSLPKKK
jgi:TonB family protein